jgi:phage repressor protein C with HTH and peptisase S24 domain
MARHGRGGRGLKRVLEWLLDRDVIDAEIATALHRPPATYSRRKDAEDFPTFEELELIGPAFGINPRWLQVEFGYLDIDELNDFGQLRVQPHPTMTLTPMSDMKTKARTPRIADLPVREDAPTLGE